MVKIWLKIPSAYRGLNIIFIVYALRISIDVSIIRRMFQVKNTLNENQNTKKVRLNEEKKLIKHEINGILNVYAFKRIMNIMILKETHSMAFFIDTFYHRLLLLGL